MTSWLQIIGAGFSLLVVICCLRLAWRAFTIDPAFAAELRREGAEKRRKEILLKHLSGRNTRRPG